MISKALRDKLKCARIPPNTGQAKFWCTMMIKYVFECPAVLLNSGQAHFKCFFAVRHIAKCLSILPDSIDANILVFLYLVVRISEGQTIFSHCKINGKVIFIMTARLVISADLKMRVIKKVLFIIIENIQMHPN